MKAYRIVNRRDSRSLAAYLAENGQLRLQIVKLDVNGVVLGFVPRDPIFPCRGSGNRPTLTASPSPKASYFVHAPNPTIRIVGSATQVCVLLAESICCSIYIN